MQELQGKREEQIDEVGEECRLETFEPCHAGEKPVEAEEMTFSLQRLQDAEKEKNVENLLNKYFGVSTKLEYLSSSDGVYDSRLFEYKCNHYFYKNGKWSNSAYKALAQTIFYLKRISWFEFEKIEHLPSLIVVADNHGGFVVPAKMCEYILKEEPLQDGVIIDWQYAPSSPDPKLITYLKSIEFFSIHGVTYIPFDSLDKLQVFKNIVMTVTSEIPQIEITERNFVQIFKLWRKELFPSGDTREVADNYVIDLDIQYRFIDGTSTLIHPESGRQINVPKNRYEKFWKFYRRPPEISVRRYILSHKDALYDDDTRNDLGDRYTPLKLADLAHKYLKQSIDKHDYDTAIWWDCAAGGANLLAFANDKSRIILSTILDVDYRTLSELKYYNEAIIKQMNFLVDKIPAEIERRLQNSAEPIIFLINPPFNDQSGYSGGKENDPNKVDASFIKKGDNLSLRNMRGIYAKFMYKIYHYIKQYKKEKAYIGVFSKTAWLNGVDYDEFRSLWFSNFKYKNGFIAPSKLFTGIKGNWPVLFSVWQYGEETTTEEIRVDIIDKNYYKVGTKRYTTRQKKDRLSDIIVKPEKPLLTKFVPLKNECEIYDKEPLYLDKMMTNSYGYLRIISNDVQNSGCELNMFSAPFGGSNHNGIYITAENFETCLCVYGIRKSIIKNWINDKDEFLIYKDINRQPKWESLFRKAILWSIVEGGYTSSLNNMSYKGCTYNIRNHLFALRLDEIENVANVPRHLLPETDTVAAMWVRNNEKLFDACDIAAISAYKRLIIHTFTLQTRLKGDPKRQCQNPDASPRQLINGLYEYDHQGLSEEEKQLFDAYIKSCKKLKLDVAKLVKEMEIIVAPDLLESA